MLPKSKMTDEKKLEEVFKNCNICIKKGDETIYPKLIRKNETKNVTTFHYTLPLGLSSEQVETVIPALKEALNKEIETNFEEVFIIKVFKNDLPEKWSYEEALIRKRTWKVPIGKTYEGILYHDFDQYPHMLIGGVTRFGKSVFLKQLLYSLISSQPENLNVFILDLKGGLEFSRYFTFPQVKALATDVFEAEKVLEYIVKEIKSQQLILKQRGYTNIADTPNMKRTFIIVDEGAELAPGYVKEGKKEAMNCQTYLSTIARIGGALGHRLVYCTQYPTASSGQEENYL